MSALDSVLSKTANLWIETSQSSQREIRKNFRKRYWDMPDQFVIDCIEFPPGQGPAPYQCEILNAVVSKRRVCARSMHGAGKCVGLDEDILLADGRYIKAKDLLGRFFVVPSFHENGKIEPSIAFASDNGVKPVYRIKTRYGRELIRTGNHPLLKFEGWTPVSDLSVGDKLAMPTLLPVSGSRPMPEEDIKALAYLIGDGSLVSHVAFIQKDGPALEEFKKIVESKDCKVTNHEMSYRISVNGNSERDNIASMKNNPFMDLLRTHNLNGKNSFKKHIPDAIFELPNNQVSIFLNRLFSTDGWAYSGLMRGGNEIGYTSVSRNIVVGVQRLLLRFGIVGRVRRKKTTWTHNGKRNISHAWSWEIHDAQNILRFAEKINIYGKEKAVQDCVDVAKRKLDTSGAHTQLYQRWPTETLDYALNLAQKQGHLCKDLHEVMGTKGRSRNQKITTVRVKKAVEFLDDEKLTAWSNLGWDIIDEIECIGEQPTIAISVPETETYIVDLVEHNSSLMSWAILWFALTRDGETDWKIPTTASAWRQLTKFLWPEVHKWSRKIRWDLVGREPFSLNTELLTMSLRLQTGEAFALASNDSSLIEGAHATELLYVFDESKMVPDETWDSAEGAMSTAGTRWLSVSTPGEPVGRFYDIQSRKPGYEDWWTRAVKTPEVVKAGRVDPEWVDQRRKQWGANSPRYKNRVLGEFAESEQDSVIPLSWIEGAQERWNVLQEGRVDPGPLSQLGVDVARYGDDSTVFAFRHGNVIHKVQVQDKEDTMATAGRVTSILRSNIAAVASVDVIGVGAGVYDKAREDHPNRVIAFNSSRGTDFVDQSEEWRFVDTRSAAIWHMRELLDPANEHQIAIPDDDMLTGDLVSPRWSPVSGGRIRVESKKDIHKRIGRSTNHGDAVVAAFWGEDAEAGMEFA